MWVPMKLTPPGAFSMFSLVGTVWVALGPEGEAGGTQVPALLP